MESVYKLNRRKMITYLLIFFLASGIVTYISAENAMKYKRALEQYDESVKSGTVNAQTMDWDRVIERDRYSQAVDRYYMRALGIFIVCAIEILMLYEFFLKIGRLELGEEGINVYSVFRKKPREFYAWKNIGGIKFQYGEGLGGFLSEYGMKISRADDSKVYRNSFVSTGKLSDFADIPNAIARSHPDLHIEIQTGIEKKPIPISNIFSGAYNEYKRGIGDYMKYSIIILVFALLKIILKNPPVNIMAVVASIYFGYRSKISMNYRAFMSQTGGSVDFDMVWDYSKVRIGKYFGITIVVELIMFIFIVLEYFCISSGLGAVYKIILGILIAGVGIFTAHRIYLLPYIASTVEQNVSCLSVNAFLIKKYSREVAFALALSAMQIIPLAVVVGMYYMDTYLLNYMLDNVRNINIAMGLFIIPYTSCLVMEFLGMPLSRLGGGDKVEDI